MGQQVLPLYIDGETSINTKVSYESADDGNIYYYLYCLPVSFHPKNDIRGFQMTTSQLILNGHCRNCEIVRAFGVSEISVKRSVKKLREEGAGGFYKARKTRKGGTILTPEVLEEAQGQLEEGGARSEVAANLSIKVNTLSKAIQSGKLVEPKKKVLPAKLRAKEIQKTTGRF